MSWLRHKIAPSPHLLDPKETRKSSKSYFNDNMSDKQLGTWITDQKRAIEHEQAILEGACDAMEERIEKRNVRPTTSNAQQG